MQNDGVFSVSGQTPVCYEIVRHSGCLSFAIICNLTLVSKGFSKGFSKGQRFVESQALCPIGTGNKNGGYP